MEELNHWYDGRNAGPDRGNIQILKQIEENLGLTFVPDKSPYEGGKKAALPGFSNVCFMESFEVRDEYKQTFTLRDLLDYIYAVLHSPRYREKYKGFLKIDFSKVSYLAPPYPSGRTEQSSPEGGEQAVTNFWKLADLGGELRQLHLLESPKVEHYITSYPIEGSNEITTKIGKKDWELTSSNPVPPAGGPFQNEAFGRIWINGTQYFDKMPVTAWEFYIGGYRPAQKWLNDRRGLSLDFGDILHYQKIIVALTETDHIMKEIDAIEIG